MARRSFTPEQLQEFQSFAAQWGKIIARRAFGDDGPGLDVDLDALEQLTRAAGLSEGIVQTLSNNKPPPWANNSPVPSADGLVPYTARNALFRAAERIHASRGGVVT